MDRRKAIINLSLSAAGLGFSSALIASLESCTSKREPGYKLLTFSQEEDVLVQQLVELIIPTTDTPGAREAGVHQYIDRVLAQVSDPEEKKVFLGGLKNLNLVSETDLGNPFIELTEEQQIGLLKQEELASYESPGPHFFKVLKGMTIYGYYTSEIGASEELQYVHATGTYKGDIPYSDVGKNYY